MKQTITACKLKYCLWGIISMLLLNFYGHAQTSPPEKRPVTVKVLSKTGNDPVPGATVAIKGTDVKGLTDGSGSFLVKARPGDVLVISSVGYARKEIKVGTSTTIEVQVDLDYNKMEDVIVVGYGRMKKTDMSSSQVTVTAADIQKTVNTTFDQALQGRAANVYVTSSSGQPGAAPSVIIRGVSSLTGSVQPLYVID
ncbi:MAG TPA: carboxypeptidase-like regulatory domain-containing protein, partial [Chitinophagaceae bacterium]|nr:carboxypeptidase-like regulatory domain-containing protein [Chitinophagaceae bacterium]